MHQELAVDAHDVKEADVAADDRVRSSSVSVYSRSSSDSIRS